MAFESRVSASTVHICIIRLLLEPRDLPGEDGGTEVKVKACKSVGQVVDTHWLDMVYLNWPIINKIADDGFWPVISGVADWA